jgi:uncharacterized protein YeaO (DUF488 family)
MMTEKHPVKVGRAYDERVRGDGARVLVDRIWPRGLSKEKADFDEWCKEVAPSTELRKWYGHDPKLFAEFTRRSSDLIVLKPCSIFGVSLNAVRSRS